MNHLLQRTVRASVLSAVALCVAAAPGFAGQPQPPGNQQPNPAKVRICHLTGSSGTAYTELVVGVDNFGGHAVHAGDIIPAPTGGCPTSSGPPDCQGAGLPCNEIPGVPSYARLLAALLAGVVLAVGVTRMRSGRWRRGRGNR